MRLMGRKSGSESIRISKRCARSFAAENRYDDGPLPRNRETINSAAKSLNARFTEARRRTSAPRFQPFLTPEGRSMIHPLLDLPEVLAANMD